MGLAARKAVVVDSNTRQTGVSGSGRPGHAIARRARSTGNSWEGLRVRSPPDRAGAHVPRNRSGNPERRGASSRLRTRTSPARARKPRAAPRAPRLALRRVLRRGRRGPGAPSPELTPGKRAPWRAWRRFEGRPGPTPRAPRPRGCRSPAPRPGGCTRGAGAGSSAVAAAKARPVRALCRGGGGRAVPTLCADAATPSASGTVTAEETRGGGVPTCS